MLVMHLRLQLVWVQSAESLPRQVQLCAVLVPFDEQCSKDSLPILSTYINVRTSYQIFKGSAQSDALFSISDQFQSNFDATFRFLCFVLFCFFIFVVSLIKDNNVKGVNMMAIRSYEQQKCVSHESMLDLPYFIAGSKRWTRFANPSRATRRRC